MSSEKNGIMPFVCHILVYCDGYDRRNRGYSAGYCDNRGACDGEDAPVPVGGCIGQRPFSRGPKPPARIITETRRTLRVPRSARVTWDHHKEDGGWWLGTVSIRAAGG